MAPLPALELGVSGLLDLLAEAGAVLLGDARDDVLYELAHRAFVKVFGYEYQPDPATLQDGLDGDVIHEVSGQAVDLVDQNNIDSTLLLAVVEGPLQFLAASPSSIYWPIIVQPCFFACSRTSWNWAGMERPIWACLSVEGRA